MVLMCLSPLSPSITASFPHVLESSGHPAVPNPILESQFPQSSSLLPRIPILALLLPLATLNPSLLQLACKEASGPISVFHVSRPRVVERYCPSAISEYKESATLFMRIKTVFCWSWIFIPRQILEKGVFQ